MALLRLFSCLCCIFIVLVNIAAIIIGILLTLLGCLFTWGFAVFTSTLAGQMSGMLGSITSLLRTNFSVDIDLVGLIASLGQITGSMGAAFLVIGICLVTIGGLGCCGACCSSNPCLLVYEVFVGAMVLAQAAVVAIWFINSDVLKQLAKQAMTDSLRKYTGINSKNIQSLVQNVVQIFVGCCGVDNGTDFYNLSPDWVRSFTYNRSGYNFAYNMTYPITCCKFNLTSLTPVDDFCSYNNTNRNTSWYQVGCYGKLFDQIDQYFRLNFIFLALGGIIGLQTLLALGAGLMMSHISAKNKVQPA